MRVLTVCGSLQARSSNRALLRTAHRVAPAGVAFVDAISVGEIPPAVEAVIAALAALTGRSG